MIRTCMTVLLPSGARLYKVQQAHESWDEARGRIDCEIEEAIMGKRLTPTPKGTKWVTWRHDRGGRPDDPGCFGNLIESTGEPYAARHRMLPGCYNLREARIALGLKP